MAALWKHICQEDVTRIKVKDDGSSGEGALWDKF